MFAEYHASNNVPTMVRGARASVGLGTRMRGWPKLLGIARHHHSLTCLASWLEPTANTNTAPSCHPRFSHHGAASYRRRCATLLFPTTSFPRALELPLASCQIRILSHPGHLVFPPTSLLLPVIYWPVAPSLHHLPPCLLCPFHLCVSPSARLFGHLPWLDQCRRQRNSLGFGRGPGSYTGHL